MKFFIIASTAVIVSFGWLALMPSHDFEDIYNRLDELQRSQAETERMLDEMARKLEIRDVYIDGLTDMVDKALLKNMGGKGK